MPAKGRKRQKKINLEELYCNKDFIPPKEQSLETIFEEPRQAKSGETILTSVRKYKRYLHFESDSQNKIQKRKRNAKKCVKKLKSTYRALRSSPEDFEVKDLTLSILTDLSPSSSESDEDISELSSKHPDTPAIIKTVPIVKTSENVTSITVSVNSETSSSEVLGTPKRSSFRNRRTSVDHASQPVNTYIGTPSTSQTSNSDTGSDEVFIATSDTKVKNVQDRGKNLAFDVSLTEAPECDDDKRFTLEESPRKSCNIS